MANTRINGINIYYELLEQGAEDNTLIFLNGVMASTGSWDLMVPFFRQLGYRVLLHDFRGQLKSEKPAEDWSFDDHVEDLKALMEFTGIKKAHLIGTSYGGETALYFAVKYPALVSSITVIDSVSELSPLLEAAVNSWIDAAQGFSGRRFYRLMMPWLYSSSFIAANRDMLHQREAGMEKVPADYYRGQAALYRTFLTINITAELKKISCPALIICGEEDILKPPAFSRIMAEEIRDSRLVLIPECGHVAIFEHPDQLNSLISGFIAGVR